MDISALIVAIAAGLGGSAGIVAIIKVVLPWVRRLVPTAVAISGALEASQTRLVASLTAERVELEGRLKRSREAEAESLRALAECLRAKAGDRG